MESARRRDAQEELGLTTSKEQNRIDHAIEQEEARQRKKEQKRHELETDSSYRLVKSISTVMDKFFLDPIIGFFLPALGDILTSALTLPYITVALFKIRSIPLTLAIIYNMLVDMMLGIIPFWIGDILDIFSRSYVKNYRLIVGFVEDDKEVIHEVNRKAIFTGICIVVFCLLIYWLTKAVIYLTTELWEWISGLF